VPELKYIYAHPYFAIIAMFHISIYSLFSFLLLISIFIAKIFVLHEETFVMLVQVNLKSISDIHPLGITKMKNGEMTFIAGCTCEIFKNEI
jgi:hypothetical protein